MATAADIIASARYDLNDYQAGIMWDDVELLNYLNRMVGVMDSTLAALDSDLIQEIEIGIDCVADQSYVDISALNSGLWTRIRWVWLGQTLITQTSPASILYKNMFETTSALPRYWTNMGDYINFNCPCASAYDDLTIHYMTKSATLTSSTTMPYSGVFDETFREMLVLYAQAKKDGNPSAVNGMMNALFQRKAMEITIQRNFVERPYYIGF